MLHTPQTRHLWTKNRNKRRKLRPSKNLHTREKGKVEVQLWLYAENSPETEFKLGLEPEKCSVMAVGSFLTEMRSLLNTCNQAATLGSLQVVSP